MRSGGCGEPVRCWTVARHGYLTGTGRGLVGCDGRALVRLVGDARSTGKGAGRSMNRRRVREEEPVFGVKETARRGWQLLSPCRDCRWRRGAARARPARGYSTDSTRGSPAPSAPPPPPRASGLRGRVCTSRCRLQSRGTAGRRDQRARSPPRQQPRADTGYTCVGSARGRRGRGPHTHGLQPAHVFMTAASKAPVSYEVPTGGAVATHVGGRARAAV